MHSPSINLYPILHVLFSSFSFFDFSSKLAKIIKVIIPAINKPIIDNIIINFFLCFWQHVFSTTFIFIILLLFSIVVVIWVLFAISSVEVLIRLDISPLDISFIVFSLSSILSPNLKIKSSFFRLVSEQYFLNKSSSFSSSYDS